MNFFCKQIIDRQGGKWIKQVWGCNKSRREKAMVQTRNGKRSQSLNIFESKPIEIIDKLNGYCDSITL